MERFPEDKERENSRILQEEKEKKERERDDLGRYKPMELPDIEEVLPQLIAGDSYRVIAARYDISLATLHKLLSLPANVARVRAALDLSAHAYAELALKALDQAEMTMPGVTIAREKAAYYKWLAAKRSPKYSEQKIVDITQTTRKIIVKSPELPFIDVDSKIVTPYQVLPGDQVNQVPEKHEQPEPLPNAKPNAEEYIWKAA